MTLVAAVRALQALAAILAVLVARRRVDHRPVALFLVTVTIANAIRVVLQQRVLWPALTATGGATLSGAGVRVALHVEQALFLTWYAGFAALAVIVFLGRRPWLVAVAWALAVAALATSYPILRNDPLRRFYLGCELASLTVAIGSIVQWAWRREAMTLPRLVVLCVVGIDCGLLVGPYYSGPFTTWERAQGLYLVLYSALILIQGGSLWRSSSSKSDLQSDPGALHRPDVRGAEGA